ncbi:hypothetical protein H5410_053626 [Solanum commersonii]|uniref:Uncharacterized protein n=1 Tax=Solanum commersonii TaxID=4109 RepID=A0A9J5X5E4_SOLCO|nr:hypothetical protein H5410_053626 [Solanum commersonii]
MDTEAFTNSTLKVLNNRGTKSEVVVLRSSRFSAIACSYETYKAKLLGPCAARAMNHLVPQDELARVGSPHEDIFPEEW